MATIHFNFTTSEEFVVSAGNRIVRELVAAVRTEANERGVKMPRRMTVGGSSERVYVCTRQNAIRDLVLEVSKRFDNLEFVAIN